MSQYTTEEILDMIEKNGGPDELDLPGKDLRGIDLSSEKINAIMLARGLSKGSPPEWYSPFTESANLRGTHLENASLGGSRLESANLWRAHLDNANFWQAHLDNADLTLARLENADLWRAHLENANLQDAHLENVYLRGARLDGTRLVKGQLFNGIGEEVEGSWSAARDVYRELKRNFASLGDYQGVAWAYVKERRMERHSFFPSDKGERHLRKNIAELPHSRWWQRFLNVFRKRWLYVKIIFSRPGRMGLDRPRWLRNLGMEALCDYGDNV